METRVLNNLSVYGSLVMADNVTDFPLNPAIGTFIVKDQCLYGYIKIGGLTTWYPFASKTNSYIHSQGVASTQWLIQHNLGTTNVWSQVKDSQGSIVQALIEIVDENNLHITFTTAITGTAVVVAPDSINVPQVEASLIDVGQGKVIIDTSGIRIDGEYVLTSGNIEFYAEQAVAAETTARIAADSTLQANLNAEISARIAADSAHFGATGNAHGAATQTVAGFMSAVDKIKLDGVSAGAEVNQNAFSNIVVSGQSAVAADSATDTVTFAAGTGVTVTTDAVNNVITIANSAPDQNVSLTGSGATTVTGTYPNFTISSTDTDTTYSATGGLTLSGTTFSLGVPSTLTTSTTNSSSGTTHTHAVAFPVTSVNSKTGDVSLSAADVSAISIAEKGSANGVATLDASGMIPSSQLPSYIDDVLEYANQSGFPAVGEAAKIYVALDTNKIYRWTGSTYIEISPVAGNADTATKLAVERTIALAGDASGSVSFDGSADVTITVAVANDSHTHSFTNLTSKPSTLSGYGITDAVAANSAIAANTATKITYDAKGLVTAGASLVAADIPSLDASKITSGTFAPAQLGSGTADSTTYLRGDGSWATVSGGATLSDDTTTNATYYPTFAIATTGAMTAAKVASTKLTFNPSTGTLAATVFNSTSDVNKKHDIVTAGAGVVQHLRGVEFKWNDNNHQSSGVIAQEVEAVLPHLVDTDGEGGKTVNYNGLVAYLIEAIKDQQKQIDLLKAALNK